MSEVKRVEIDHKGLPFFDDKGAYVFYEDFAALKADRDAQQKRADALAVESRQLKEMNSRLCAELQEYESDNDDFGPAPQSVVNCFALLTPNTDAALAAIEARVWAEAKDLAKSMLASDSADCIDFLFDGKIQQLREAK